VAELQEKYHQFVIEYIPDKVLQLVFFIQRNIFNSRTEKWLSTADALKWHLWLGHPGPEALRYLVNYITGVKIKGIPTFECEACVVAKAKQQIWQEPQNLHEGPGHRLAIDFHNFKKGYRGYTLLMLVTDCWSGYMWDFYLLD
jgi:hypothetical protein